MDYKKNIYIRIFMYLDSLGGDNVINLPLVDIAKKYRWFLNFARSSRFIISSSSAMLIALGGSTPPPKYIVIT